MIETTIIVVRLLQYLGAMVLMGSSLFFIYAFPRSGPASATQLGWPRALVAGAAALLCFSSLVSIAAQASLFAGSWTDGLTNEAIAAVATSMDLGRAALARVIFSGAALATLLPLSRRRAVWWIAGGLGVLAAASLAWMGHGGSTEGALGLLHLLSDVVHVLAAAVWIGALVAFTVLSSRRHASAAAYQALHSALNGFAGVGSSVVALLLVTGLINSWVLVGPENVSELLTTPYGRLLTLKLLLFGGMVAIATANRLRLVPALGRTLDRAGLAQGAVTALRRSLALETGLSLGVLLLVGWLGTLQPPPAT
jgi:putative copper resistance protein D